MTATTPTTARAQPSLLRIAALLGAVALVAGLWTVYRPNVAAGSTVAVFLVWGVGRLLTTP
jgi:ABC-type Mn2+/Zn2+ transport system permease subunit